jgi:hypothetical protein
MIQVSEFDTSFFEGLTYIGEEDKSSCLYVVWHLGNYVETRDTEKETEYRQHYSVVRESILSLSFHRCRSRPHSLQRVEHDCYGSSKAT